MTRLPTLVRRARLILLCFALMASSLSAHAEILVSRPLLIDISNTYGFVTEQNHLLGEISKKYPSISRLAMAAERQFLSKFKPALDSMDSLMAKHSGTAWRNAKRSFAKSMKPIDTEQVSEADAREYIDLVRERAKGHMDSPVIETLLMFDPEYKDHPVREFHDNYRYRYSADGSGKAKGVAFTMKSPKSWKAKEGERPNIIQRFVSENGRGLEVFTILIAEIPFFEPGQEITHEDIHEMVRSREVIAFAPDNSTYIDSGEMVLENLPGFWLRYKISATRVKQTLSTENILYNIFYKDKVIQMQGAVLVARNQKSEGLNKFEQYEPLFDLMANSLVIHNMYVQ